MKTRTLSILIGVGTPLVVGFFIVQSHRSAMISFTNQENRANPEALSVVPVNTDRMENADTSPEEVAQSAPVEQKTNAPKAPTDTVISAPIPENSQKTVSEKTVAPSKFSVSEKLVTFGFAVPSKPRTIDTIVLHSSYDAVGSDPYSVSGVIAEWKGYDVAPHYLIARDGHIYRLVKDENIAYHAGVSKVSDGRTNVNDFSIGIEILNTKTDDYTDAQYTAVKKLIGNLKEKYAIKYVLGHDDIAPGRKTDPWNFEWKKL